jgi:hypothetical protein
MMAAAEHDRLQDTLAMLKLLAQSQQALTHTRRLLSTSEVRNRAKSALANIRKR